MFMRRLFVAGNWKMTQTLRSAAALAAGVAERAAGCVEHVDVAVAPAFVHLQAVREALLGSPVKLAAQNAYFEEAGAFTGEISIDMLGDAGCSWVILGHSERRHVLGESDELINRKVRAALGKGLSVILCVGELIEERQAEQTTTVLDRQMNGDLADVDSGGMGRVVIAYEPVWAIGTGLTATPEQAQNAHAHLRNWLRNRYTSEVAEATRIQYGGSVKPENARELMAQPDIDGALVGGASLKAESFGDILDEAASAAKSQ
jgi:triosephosphate isomerase (TIM)